jgi:MFS family permease
MVGSAGVGIGAFSVFLPTFIREFGFSRLETQLYSMIPYAFGLLGLVFFSWLSDHLRQRAWVTILCLCITATGFIILLATTNKVALVAGACFVAGGAYPSLVVSISWMMTFHGGYTKRATASWINQVFIQGYSIMASQIYRNPPRYFLGHGISLAIYAIAIVSAMTSWWICSRANKAKDQRQAEFAARGEVDPDMGEDYERLCDYHPGYRYTT